MCDTKEMADALNQRIHDETIDADAPTVTAARGQRIAVGDLIISRRNDPSIGVFDATDIHKPADPVRNGNRWHVYAVDTDNHRIAGRRLDDGARAAFSGDYLRQHITHGYAVTVHTAQGVTAEVTHAVLGENTTRALLYVAMTRGHDTNQAEIEDRDELPDRVRRLLDRRIHAVQARRAAYRHWCDETAELLAERERWIDQHIPPQPRSGLGLRHRPLAVPNTQFGTGFGRRAAARSGQIALLGLTATGHSLLAMICQKRRSGTPRTSLRSGHRR